jgi:hypothetical protein
MKSESEPATPPVISRCGVPGPGFLQDSVEEKIADFLNGRTHGEELLHALFDHILDEPVPERLRASDARKRALIS